MVDKKHKGRGVSSRKYNMSGLRESLSINRPMVIVVFVKKFNVELSIAEDLYQEVCISILENSEKANNLINNYPIYGEKGIQGYLIKAMTYYYFDFLKIERKRDGYRTNIEMIYENLWRENEENIVDKIDRREKIDIVINALKFLEEPYRSIIFSVLVSEMNLSEVAKHLNIKGGSIYTMMQRALEKLKYFIERSIHDRTEN